MREIRTYGLMRGRWPVRFARRAGVYSTVKGPISPQGLRDRIGICQRRPAVSTRRRLAGLRQTR